jgi:Transglutaminase-like superfamily
MPALRRIRLKWALWRWARLVPFMAYRSELKPLLARTAPGDGRPFAGLEARDIARLSKRAVRGPWFMRDRRCLREGLLAFRFLTLAGYRPTLHFGVDRGSVARSTLAAHCWITLDGSILLNAPETDMVEILLYTGSSLQPPVRKASSFASI